MSTEIEREVVQMIFDAKQFHKGVESSIEDLDTLKKSFDFTNAQRSMNDLTRLGSGDHFGPMAKSLDALNSKISVMGVIAATAISRLTNAVIDGSKQLFNTLILTPIKTGLEEYETQLNAVQTILANTKKDGTTLEYVNDKLDELNTYADLTIYNFTQMTDSIGKFTAAGVDIDTSVASIKGIANVAALSGSNAQQASTAMYQLSQAMASGTVRLQDWMSVENAGMGGAVFQDALMETAKVHGIAVDRMVESNGSFRLSLQEGWLTSDIMAETLSKFTGDLTAEQLRSMGYAEDQIVAIQEMATAANDAATKIKTLTQLKDTMAEAMQSGWGQTWRIIFGDFEQAKELWGNIAEVFGGLIEGSSAARNSMLELWAGVGGRVALIDGAMALIQALINIFQAFGEAIREVFAPLDYIDLFQITFAFKNFAERLLEVSQNLGPFKTIVEAVASVLWIVLEVAKSVGYELWNLFDGVNTGGSAIFDMVLKVANAIIAFREWAIETDGIAMAVETFFWRLQRLGKQVREVAQQFLELEIIQDIRRYFEGLDSQTFVKVWDGLVTVLQAISVPIIAVALALKQLYDVVKELEIVKIISEYFKGISYAGIKTGFKNIADAIKGVIDSVRGHEVLQAFGDFFRTFDGRRFTAFIDNAKGGLSGFVESIKNLNREAKETPENMEAVSDSVVESNRDINDSIVEGLENLTTAAGTLDYSRIFEVLNVGLLAGLLVAIKKIADMDLFGTLLGDEISEGIADSLEGLTGALKGMEMNLKAEALKSIAVAIALLAGSLVLLTLVDTTKLAVATIAIAAFVTALFGGAGALNKIDLSSSAKATLVMAGIAASMVILAVALRAVQGIDPENLETTIAVMAAGIASLVIAVSGLSKGAGGEALKSIAVMMGLATAMLLLAAVVHLFGSMDPDTVSQGIAGMGGSLGILVAGILTISRLNKGSLITAGIAISEMAASMIILYGAVKQFGSLPMDILTQGLQAMALVLGAFAAASRLLKNSHLIEAGISILFISIAMWVLYGAVEKFGSLKWDEIQRGLLAMAGALAIIVIASRGLMGALPAAAAMIIMSAGLVLLAGALKILSTLDWQGLLIGLVGIAGVFLVLGVAAALMAPLVPILLLLGLALAAMGVAALAFGAGISLAATGLIALAGASAAVSGVILAIGAAIMQVLPEIAKAIAHALINFLEVIAENQPRIIEAMHAIVLGMIEAIWGLIPKVVETILEMITQLLQAIADKLPDMIQAGWDILLSFLEGIANNIQEVVTMGFTIVTEIINGIAEGLPDLIDSAFNLILTFLNGMADAIEEYMPQIIDAGLRIGEALVEGTIKGVTQNASRLYEKMTNMAQKAWEKVKGVFGIESPSKRMYELGVYIVLGLVNAIGDHSDRVFEAMQEMAEKGQNGISSLQNALLYAMEDVFDYSPVITPVLNLDAVNAGARQLANGFFAAGTVAAIANENGSFNDAVFTSDGAPSGGSKSVQYIQNNYSPKALDEFTIYRQTKTHVAKLALEEL